MVDTEYTWLFSDDDIMTRGAVEIILRNCETSEYDLILPDREYRKPDLSYDYGKRTNNLKSPKIYLNNEKLLVDSYMKHFSFIGCLIFKVSTWRKVVPEKYLPIRYFPHSCVIADMMLQNKNAIWLPECLIHVRGSIFSWSRESIMVWFHFLPESLCIIKGYSNAIKRKVMLETCKEMLFYSMWECGKHKTRWWNTTKFFSARTVNIYSKLHAWHYFLGISVLVLGMNLIPFFLVNWGRDYYRKLLSKKSKIHS